jgi:hypothetical protein
MPAEPPDGAVPRGARAAGRRLHIHGIKEMPAGFDAELAALFRDLRGATNLSLGDLAGQLGTQPNVIQALEEGAVYALPPWPETERVVDGYGALLGLDVRPLLRRIHAQLTADIAEPVRRTQPAAPQVSPPPPPPNGGQMRPMPPLGPVAEQARPTAQPQAQPRPHPQQPQPQPRSGPAGPRPEPVQGGAPPPPPSWPPPGQAPGAPPQLGAPPQSGQRTAPDQPNRLQASKPQAMAEWSAQTEAAPAQQRRRADQAPPQPEAEAPKRKSGVVKWGLIGFLIFGVLVGFWLLTSGPAVEEGVGVETEEQVPAAQEDAADPDDPKSRKTDRLPGPL